MTIAAIRKQWQRAVQTGAAIAFYRLPGKSVQVVEGGVSASLKKGEAAFAMVKFNGEKCFIVSGKAKTATSVSKTLQPKPSTKNTFKIYVEKALHAIAGNDFKKVVTARCATAKLPEQFDPIGIFNTCCKKYKSTFCSLVHLPGEGIWIGATPEILVEERGENLVTYSLAGTINAKTIAGFSSKEREEQQLVTDFIKKTLARFSKTVNLSPVETIHAGKLTHLRNVFVVPKVVIEPVKLAAALHPTPAVGGLPRKSALAFISENEKLDREYYSGYLGPIHHQGNTSLWVNLRCVKVTNQIIFYAGCGITQGSNPESEWQETENKMEVMRAVILNRKTTATE